MTAVAMAKKQAKLRNVTPKTPQKTQEPTKMYIGSSSTWRQEQLDHFKVRIRNNVIAQEMVPVKWFDFKSLDRYNESYCAFIYVLTYSKGTNNSD
jgi:hypothetical protein